MLEELRFLANVWRNLPISMLTFVSGNAPNKLNNIANFSPLLIETIMESCNLAHY
jgi:hypothetical protein